MPPLWLHPSRCTPRADAYRVAPRDCNTVARPFSLATLRRSICISLPGLRTRGIHLVQLRARLDHPRALTSRRCCFFQPSSVPALSPPSRLHFFRVDVQRVDFTLRILSSSPFILTRSQSVHLPPFRPVPLCLDGLRPLRPLRPFRAPVSIRDFHFSATMASESLFSQARPRPRDVRAPRGGFRGWKSRWRKAEGRDGDSSRWARASLRYSLRSVRGATGPRLSWLKVSLLLGIFNQRGTLPLTRRMFLLLHLGTRF